MIEKLTPFEETRMYQELLEHEKIGEKRGERRGEALGEARGEKRGRLNMLKIQLDQGIIDEKQYHQLLDTYIKDEPEQKSLVWSSCR